MDFDEADREEFRLRKGDVLICEGGEVGRCAIWDDELPECYFQKALHRARPVRGAATSEFIVYLFRELARGGSLLDAVSKVTFAHLTGVKLKALRIPIPPVSLQEKFSSHVRAFKQAHKAGEAVRNEHDRLFQAVVRRAFRGDLTASWREAHMKELLQEMEFQAKTLAEAP
jgi:type I restriction enzyme S subunit